MRTHPVAGFVLVCLAVSTTWAQPLGTAFTYQGRLKNGGSPANGSFNMDFKLYSVVTGGSPLASQTVPGVSVTDDLFTVQVDFGPGMFDGNQRWLEVTVNGSPLVPRQELKAAPYAHMALNADRLDGLDSAAFLTSVPNPLSLSGASSAYIIGGSNSSTVNGAAGLAGTATGTSGQVYGVQGVTLSTNGFGVFGSALSSSGPAHGGFFESASTDGIGVVGQAKATTGAAYGVYGQSVSSSGRGVFGLATSASGVTYGGQFESTSPSGNGVFGHATAPSGNTIGVIGQTASPTGHAVEGYAYNANGANYGGYFRSAGEFGRGVYGLATSATGTNAGGFFESASDEGTGVVGLATTTSANGYTSGVVGQAASSIGRGVFGRATSTSGVNYGLWGQSDSTAGRGVYGFASAATGTTIGGSFESSSSGPFATGVYGLSSALTDYNYGVWGQSNSTSGIGVLAINDRSSGFTYGVFARSSSENGKGVYGLATATSGSPFGVVGECTTMGGFGVYSGGNMAATGNKAFRIDHPDDPSNKYLLHYCAESPEVINFYSGKVMLDANGEAVVELPHYFASINKDPRYTLTAVGAPMPLLHVADEIDEAALSAGGKAEPGQAVPACFFRIAGGAPNAKVSWEVKALRNDRWVQRHGAPVEVEKQGLEKGTYQHPDLYGQPPEKGMNYGAAHRPTGPTRPVPPTPAESISSAAAEPMCR